MPPGYPKRKTLGGVHPGEKQLSSSTTLKDPKTLCQETEVTHNLQFINGQRRKQWSRASKPDNSYWNEGTDLAEQDRGDTWQTEIIMYHMLKKCTTTSCGSDSPALQIQKWTTRMRSMPSQSITHNICEVTTNCWLWGQSQGWCRPPMTTAAWTRLAPGQIVRRVLMDTIK